MKNSKNLIFSKAREKPKLCWSCKSPQVEYWDETDEEVIFKCIECGRFMPKRFDGSKTLHFAY